MSDFDNFFDAAMNTADGRIIETMGTVIYWYPGGQETPFRGVFDVPEDNVGMNTGSGEIRDTAPTIFTWSSSVTGMAKRDRVRVGDQHYWVTDPGWDELGTIGKGTLTITLARGLPGRPAPEAPTKPSKQYGQR